MNTAIFNKPAKQDVWYKEPWLLLVIGGPLIVVCASVFTGMLAMRGADQVVAKDYYKQGLMINTNLQRDAKARELALTANMHLDLAKKSMTLQLQSKAAVPDSVQLSIATSGAEKGLVEEVVRRLPLKLTGGSSYQVDLSQVLQGKNSLDLERVKLLHIKLETNEWRLTGDWYDPLQRNLVLSVAN
ncbi:FixH family protein [Undibacterium cyanobacteriorum]|uniref:FixH family protein n=1 Tax=Undibacterium cyanobacteriorum TaxID=3073561 RepID=A0ABY9RMT6_9BURK|nr:FixH family protein [Undibacterium sp. 20NA77.5]WMW82276.1 FixH family protein [Undibacterium sp. 20NA77.5]